MSQKITNKVAWAIIIMMLAVGLFYPLFTPYQASDFSFRPLLVPSADHILGTDEMGHDILSMLLAGFRITLSIAIVAALISTFIGTALAVICAYYKNWVDTAIVKLTELFIIVPEIVVLMFFAALSKPAVYNTVFAIAFFAWSKVTRIIRAKGITAIEKEKIQYTLLMKGNLKDLLVKMWRELYPAVATMFIFQCSKAAVYESTLAFFGIGDPLAQTWGRMIRTALNFEGIFTGNTCLWYLLPPVACVLIFVAAVSILAFDYERE